MGLGLNPQQTYPGSGRYTSPFQIRHHRCKILAEFVKFPDRGFSGGADELAQTFKGRGGRELKPLPMLRKHPN